jgi:hypothetical protein
MCDEIASYIGGAGRDRNRLWGRFATLAIAHHPPVMSAPQKCGTKAASSTKRKAPHAPFSRLPAAFASALALPAAGFEIAGCSGTATKSIDLTMYELTDTMRVGNRSAIRAASAPGDRW